MRETTSPLASSGETSVAMSGAVLVIPNRSASGRELFAESMLRADRRRLESRLVRDGTRRTFVRARLVARRVLKKSHLCLVCDFFFLWLVSVVSVDGGGTMAGAAVAPAPPAAPGVVGVP